MEEKSSLVPWTLVPTPSIIQQAFDEVLGLSERTNSDRANFRSRNIFINAQWAFGGEGTGAPGKTLFFVMIQIRVLISFIV